MDDERTVTIQEAAKIALYWRTLVQQEWGDRFSMAERQAVSLFATLSGDPQSTDYWSEDFEDDGYPITQDGPAPSEKPVVGGEG